MSIECSCRHHLLASPSAGRKASNSSTQTLTTKPDRASLVVTKYKFEDKIN
ncbi:hypothetical protein Patl1_30421 [Pistacia atlantica]|uniref:Uncharacterized protein n=1 Tax=Pistacia atlantica TaxID=434234 RepID=A0ACC1ABZ5_9ROSI|nr:hypothetical protein Patl1_30421 [Pistacia atlantica]